MCILSVSEYDKQCYVNIPVEACCSDAASDNVLVCTNVDCVYKNCEIDTCLVQCRVSQIFVSCCTIMYRAMYACTLITLLVASVVQAESSSASPCPPWFIFNANISTNTPKYSHCFCSYLLPFRIMCDQMEYTSYLKLGNCAFLDNVTGDTIIGDCPYVFPGHLFVDHSLKLPQDVTELNSVMCDSLSREVGQVVDVLMELVPQLLH